MPYLNLAPFEYSERGRRPLTLAMATAGLGLAAVAAAYQAPWWVWPPFLAYLAMMLWLVLRNPVSGMRLTPDAWSFHGAGFERTLPVAQIREVRFTSWSEGPDTVRIKMTDGTLHEPPSRCLPTAEALIPHLNRARIPVTRD